MTLFSLNYIKFWCICWFILGHWPVLSISSFSSLCPASDSIPVDSAYYSYPVDIYDTEQSYRAAVHRPNSFPDENSEKLIVERPCFSVERSGENVAHNCSVPHVSSFCPIQQEYLDLALNRTKSWIRDPVLCNFADAIAENESNSNEEINVIAFGGSMTAAVATRGCCAHKECVTGTTVEDNSYCGWTNYLGRWLATLSPNIKVHNLARSGYNMDTFKNQIVDRLNKIRNNFRFTKRDIVLFDVSVNDCRQYRSNVPGKLSVLERALEATIRRIYYLSEPGSFPTIILLSTFTDERLNGNYYPQDVGCTKSYERIARYYNVTNWSYFDMFTKMYNLIHSKPSTIRQYGNEEMWNYLSFINNYHHSGHPAWHVHLFYADFIGALIQREIKACRQRNNVNRRAVTYPTVTNVAELPPPLLPQKLHHCDGSVAPLLEIAIPDIANRRNKETHAILGNAASDPKLPDGTSVYRSVPSDSWGIWEDKAGRPGLIREFSDNNHSESRLIFQLNITHEALLQSRSRIMLQIMFLRTYANAGVVQPLLCGLPLTDINGTPFVLDALWPDYPTFHFSLPEVFIPRDFTISNCREGARKDVGSKYVTIELVHRSVITGTTTVNEVKARGHEKFKLLEIKACQIASDDN